MPLSIRTRLLLLVLSVMVPGVVAALWVSWQTWVEEQDALVRHLRDNTRALSMVVDKELSRRAGIARILSLSQILDTAPQVPPEDLATLALQSRRAMQGMAGWVELSTPDRVLFTTRPGSLGPTMAPPSLAAGVGLLPGATPSSLSGNARNATLAGSAPDAAATGAPVSPAVPPALGTLATPGAAGAPGAATNAGEAGPATLTTRATDPSRALVDKPVIGGLEPDPVDGQLRAALVQPVERNGRVLMNLSVTLLPQELQQIIDTQDMPDDWTATIMDAQGTVVARHPGGTAYAGRRSTDDLRLKMAEHDASVFESTTLDGQNVIGYFSTSPQGWTFLTAVPRKSLLGGRAKALQPIVFGSLLLILAGLGGALWISRRISGPIHELTTIANKLRAGEPVQAGATGMAECDEVALALEDASAAIRQGRGELERRVNEAIVRTREAEQRSSRTQRTAALGRLTGGVAHDFNNLLGVISNSAHLIQRSPHADSLAMPVGAIMRSVEVGSRLTQHLLRVSGRQPVRPQVLDMGVALGEMKELLATVLGKRMQLTLTVAPDTRTVQLDAAELELALINIALNARDATNGMGEIVLEARNAEPYERQDVGPGDYVVITFTDKGAGIPEDVQARVFEPFFTTKEVGKGTGLGLSQVLGFCVQAGGMARIASQPGHGTTVTLLLPASGSTPSVRPELITDPGTLAGASVLLVEDNEELNRVTASLLRSFSCQVVTAANAEEALKQFGSGAAFDVVLSDVVMPGGMDGQALARELRRRRPGLPVVLISGYSTALTAESIFPVLRKPASPAQLLDALAKAMGRPMTTS
ncbi:Signal transduction histidine kinase [Roseateles sp. YR242]|uniref:ATP-binding protein n=1 Tax=Roseateles sp. YR242 TaxID=1855305 RepID=UPI0008BB1A7F|nr:ATP-binding protein [Roseateles sp. YR242]SEL18995.1 Signal transduction histidine kinase [Roseateles sp. YR242]